MTGGYTDGTIGLFVLGRIIESGLGDGDDAVRDLTLMPDGTERHGDAPEFADSVTGDEVRHLP